MNDLDRQIAEAKGYEFVTPEQLEKITGRESYWPRPQAIKKVAPRAIILASEQGDEGWSTSDSKALDLADDLTESGFEVTIASWNHGEGPQHRVTVQCEAGRYTAQATSRPVAICKAWLASREWMAGRKS